MPTSERRCRPVFAASAPRAAHHAKPARDAAGAPGARTPRPDRGDRDPGAGRKPRARAGPDQVDAADQLAGGGRNRGHQPTSSVSVLMWVSKPADPSRLHQSRLYTSSPAAMPIAAGKASPTPSWSAWPASARGWFLCSRVPTHKKNGRNDRSPTLRHAHNASIAAGSASRLCWLRALQRGQSLAGRPRTVAY